MSNNITRPVFPVLMVGLPRSHEADRLYELYYRQPEPIVLPMIAPAFEPAPIPIPDDIMVNHINPLFHTPAAIHRSVATRSSKPSLSLRLALVVTLMSTTDSYSRPQLRSTAGLKQKIKALEKTLQKHPTRTDIRLEIMEVRKQIKEIEATLKKGNKKAKQRK